MPDETEYTDIPLEECARRADYWYQQGWTIYQKWTCEGCGKRVIANHRNYLTTKGHHEDCGYITDLVKNGCGFLMEKHRG